MQIGALERIVPPARRRLPTHRTLLTVSRSIPTKLRRLSVVCNVMKLERDTVSATELNAMDRRVIRIDTSPTQAGITAALRRAFEAAASEPCDHDFADLLRKLN